MLKFNNKLFYRNLSVGIVALRLKKYTEICLTRFTNINKIEHNSVEMLAIPERFFKVFHQFKGNIPKNT